MSGRGVEGGQWRPRRPRRPRDEGAAPSADALGPSDGGSAPSNARLDLRSPPSGFARFVRSGLKRDFRSPRTRGKSLSRGRRTRGRRPRPEGAEGAEGATDPPQQGGAGASPGHAEAPPPRAPLLIRAQRSQKDALCTRGDSYPADRQSEPCLN